MPFLHPATPLKLFLSTWSLFAQLPYPGRLPLRHLNGKRKLIYEVTQPPVLPWPSGQAGGSKQGVRWSDSLFVQGTAFWSHTCSRWWEKRRGSPGRSQHGRAKKVPCGALPWWSWDKRTRGGSCVRRHLVTFHCLRLCAGQTGFRRFWRWQYSGFPLSLEAWLLSLSFL